MVTEVKKKKKVGILWTSANIIIDKRGGGERNKTEN